MFGVRGPWIVTVARVWVIVGEALGGFLKLGLYLFLISQGVLLVLDVTNVTFERDRLGG